MQWIEPRQGNLFPLRWKLLIYFLVFLAVITFVGVYANLGAKLSTRLLGHILAENRQLEIIANDLSALQVAVDDYVADGDYDSLLRYSRANVSLRDGFGWATTFGRKMDETEKHFLYIDLANSLQTVLLLSEQTVSARRDLDSESAFTLRRQLGEAVEATSKYVVSLMNRNTVIGNRQYEAVVSRTERVELLAYLLAAAVAVLGIVFVLQFTLGITQPLYQIIDNAREMASGNFRVGEIKVESNDELQIIASVFNHMATSIRDLFRKTEEKAALERQLKEEQMRNLEFANLLREAELKALQAQVNPHFLYNTLNAVSQVAVLEEADETAELIKTVASLLRYNLRRLDTPVTVEEEIKHVKTYLHIMQVRYGDQLEYELSVDKEADRYLIPCMTIQPLVENAVIHGLAKTERGGKVLIEVARHRQQLKVRIADNGVGMDPKMVKDLLKPENLEVHRRSLPPGQTTGLGIRNIVNRLRFFYDSDDVINIFSEPGQGTVVELVLPLKEGENVQSYGS